MNKKARSASPVKGAEKAPNRPQEPAQGTQPTPAGAPSRVEVAQRLLGHSEREAILAAFCAALAQPVPAEVTEDSAVRMQERASWDSKLSIDVVSSWLVSLMDAADARPQPAPERRASASPAVLGRDALARAASVDLNTLSPESSKAVRELFDVVTQLAAHLHGVRQHAAEVRAQAQKVADLEAELAKARLELQNSQAHLWHSKGYCEASAQVTLELAERLESCAWWHLLAELPLGGFDNLGAIIRAAEDTSNLPAIG